MSQTQQTPQQTAIIEQSVLDEWLDTVAVLVNEAKCHLHDDGWQIQAVDPANVAMMDTTLSAATGSSAFESYAFGGGGVIGFNVERLQDMIGIGDSGDLVHLSLDETTRKLHVEIGGFEGRMALIDPDNIRQEPDLPDLDLTAEVVFEGDWFDSAASAADMVSDYIRFGADPDAREFWMRAEGDPDDVEWALSDDELDTARVEDAADSLYSLDYVTDMTKAIPSDAAVTFEVGQQFPFDLHFELAEGAADVRYMLAPRIQSE
jgi:proliferating cell nuclear antigen